MVEHLDQALSNEEHFLNVSLIWDDLPVLGIYTAEHRDYKFISKALFTLVKEMVESALKLPEDSRGLNQICLHFRSDLMVKVEFFNDEVEIVHESLLDVFSDVVIKRGLDVVGTIALLDLLDPHVKAV